LIREWFNVGFRLQASGLCTDITELAAYSLVSVAILIKNRSINANRIPS